MSESAMPESTMPKSTMPESRIPESMIPSLPISPRYSTLELVKHDADAQAPERDNAIGAPEWNNEADALQVRSLFIEMILI